MKKILIIFVVAFLMIGAVSSLSEAGLIAYYGFEGNADDTAGTYDGTVNGATLTTGYSGQAYNFDGVNDYIYVPLNINAAALSQLTMGAWVKTDTMTTVRQIISHDNGNFDRSLGLDSRGGGGWAAFTGTGVLASGWSSVNVGQWAFLAVSYNQATNSVKLYVNGTEFTTTGQEGAAGGWNYLRIGSNPSYGEYFDGVIDEVFFYDQYLSKEELDRLRTNGQQAAIPEPASMILFGVGLVGSFFKRRLS